MFQIFSIFDPLRIVNFYLRYNMKNYVRINFLTIVCKILFTIFKPVVKLILTYFSFYLEDFDSKEEVWRKCPLCPLSVSIPTIQSRDKGQY
jgi:hypothetical protein